MTPSAWSQRILVDTVLILAAIAAAVLLLGQTRFHSGAASLATRLTGLQADDLLVIGMLVLLLSLIFTVRRMQELRSDITERRRLSDDLAFESMLLDSASDVVMVYEPGSWKVLYANEAACRARGLEKDKVVGMRLGETVSEATAAVLAWHFGSLDAETPLATFEARVEIPDGRAVDAEIAARVVEWDGRDVVISVSRDISERKRAQRDMERSRDFYLTLFEGFPAAIWRGGSDGSRDYFNRAWLEFTGRSEAQETGDGWLADLHPDDAAVYDAQRRDATARRERYETVIRLLRRDGEYRWVDEIASPFLGLDGEFLGYIGVCHDVTEKKEQADRIAYLADHDELTGLFNRRTLDSALTRALARSKRGVPSVLLFIDVDNFKNVNDTRGHQVGDEALVRITAAFKRCVREEDIVVRIGGDEFAILLEMISLPEALEIARRLCGSVRRDLAEMQLTLSVGVTALSGAGDAVEVVREADTAMYQAKQAGGDRIVCRSDQARLFSE